MTQTSLVSVKGFSKDIAGATTNSFAGIFYVVKDGTKTFANNVYCSVSDSH